MSYCPGCGSEIDSDTKFCSTCGADVTTNSSEEPSEPSKSKTTTSQPKTSGPKPEAGTYADFGPIVVAIIIDGIIIGTVYLILFFILPWFFAHLIGYVIAVLYLWLLESLNKGQTLGKMAMKLRTVNEQTLEVSKSIGDYLVNNLLKGHLVLMIIDFVAGMITNSGDPKQRFRIMQNASNTVVITTE